LRGSSLIFLGQKSRAKLKYIVNQQSKKRKNRK